MPVLKWTWMALLSMLFVLGDVAVIRGAFVKLAMW